MITADVLMLTFAVVAFHLYYRTSKYIFKPSFLNKFTSEQSYISEYYSRVLAFSTCIIISILGCCFHVPDCIRNFFTIENMFNQKLKISDKLIIICLFGYLVHDLFWCIIHKWHSFANYAHHVLVIVFCIYVFFKDNTGAEFSSGAVLAESSNIFLHLRWFVKFHTGKSSILCDSIFAIVFFLSRIIGGTWLMVVVLNSSAIHMKALCILMEIVNFGFFIQVYKMVRKTINRYKIDKNMQKMAKLAKVE